MKKRILFFGLFLLICTLGYSQSISYAYDDSGNRIHRQINLPPVAPPPATDTSNYDDDLNKFYDSLKEINFTIYPNPTQGNLILESLEDIKLINCDIFVYNQSGQLIKKTKLENKTSINLSNEEAGTYILIVKYKNEKREWKIVKL